MSNTGIEQLIYKAEHGDGEACFELYQEYKSGTNVQMDEAVALSWLEKAIDLEHPVAQLIMGLSFLNIGRVQDAIDYLDLSCSNHNLDAMNILGQLYMGNVTGIENPPVDKEKGIELLYQSAMGGNMYAQLTLGRAYYNGDGVEKNRFMASIWLEKAADQGNVEAGVLLDEINTVYTMMN